MLDQETVLALAKGENSMPADSNRMAGEHYQLWKPYWVDILYARGAFN